MLSKLSIGRRTTLVIGLMMTAMLVSAGLSLSKFSTISKRVGEITDAQVERIELSQRWDANIREAVARWSALSMAPDAALFNATKEKTLAISTDTTRVQKRFAEIEASPKGLELGKELGAARARWLAERDSVRKLIEGGDQAGATALGNGSFAAVSTEYLAVSARHAAYQVERARVDGAELTSQAQTQLQWLLGLTVFCLVAGGALGLAFVRSLVRPIEQAVVSLEALAQGDLTRDIPTDQSGEMGRMMVALRDMQDRMRGMIGNIRQTADSIQVASTEVATGNLDLSQRTEQTAGRLQQTASAMEELTATVKQTADSAGTANQLASSASEVARRGGTVVAQVITTMDEINASSKRIADIIGTIDGIAFQTNILALNAAVEAARAGEQGRGFAVVASEVRSLAQRSAEAAREIKGLIGKSVDSVESGSRLVANAGTTMTEIVASVQRVTDIIGEISAAASEQSAGIGNVNVAVTELDQMTQQNAALVEESAAAAESLREQSRQLATVVASFRLAAGASAPAVAAREVIARVSTPALVRPAQPARPAARPTATPVAKSVVRPAPAATATAPATAPADDSWETF